MPRTTALTVSAFVGGSYPARLWAYAIAAARRPMVLLFFASVAYDDRNRAAVPGVAGMDSRPRATHQAAKIGKSER